MPRTLVLTLELDDEFDDDDVMEELADVLRDHIKTGNILELHTGESDQAGIYLDEVGDSIPCYVKKVEEIA